MPQLTATAIKPNLQIDEDIVVEDDMITDFIAVAEDWIARHLNRDMDAEFPAGWPPIAVQCIRILVADYFENRGAMIANVSKGVLPTVMEILSPLRNYAGTADSEVS